MNKTNTKTSPRELANLRKGFKQQVLREWKVNKDYSAHEKALRIVQAKHVSNIFKEDSIDGLAILIRAYWKTKFSASVNSKLVEFWKLLLLFFDL